MSIRRALVAVWRNLVKGRAHDMQRYDQGYRPSAEAQARKAAVTQAEALLQTFLPRLPEHLHGALEVVALRSNPLPTDSLSLMDAVSTWRTGLGITIERGGVPSETDKSLYQHLGELERWMDQDLGHPESTQYAVHRRTVERLERGSTLGAA